MSDEIKKTSQQATEAVQGMGLGLTDMIAGMVQATVDADQAVTDDYMETFKEYAFEKDPNGGNDRLQMVDFEMVDNEGVRRLISIPKLSLLPLPVLHVSEATFDIDAKIVATASEQTVKDTPDGGDKVALKRQPTASEMKKIMTTPRYRLAFESELNKKLSKRSLTQKTGGESQAVFNAKIHIELRPTTLSNGMRGALQVVDTSIQEFVLEQSSK